MIDEACETFKIDREKSFFVGDSITDMECAQKAGVTGIFYEAGSLLSCIEKVVTK